MKDGKWLHPQIAPRLASQQQADAFPIPGKGADFADVLGEAGLGAAEVEALVVAGAVISA